MVLIDEFFYQISAKETVETLKTDAKVGLTEAEAEKRLHEHGPNKLEEGKKRPMIFRFFDQFRDLMKAIKPVAEAVGRRIV